MGTLWLVVGIELPINVTLSLIISVRSKPIVNFVTKTTDVFGGVIDLDSRSHI